MQQTEKQGYLGDLENKSDQELFDLLRRQKSLLHNQKFVERLQDKGDKIHSLVSRLTAILKEKEDVDEATDLFQRMALKAERARQQRVNLGHMDEDDDDDGDDDDPLKAMASRQFSDKRVQDERMDAEEAPTRFSNSYEYVIRKSNEKNRTKDNLKYLPSRTLKTKDFHDMPMDKLASMKMESTSKLAETQGVIKMDEQYSNEPTTSNIHKTLQDQVSDIDPNVKTGSGTSTPGSGSGRKLKYRYDECLATDQWETPKHESVKMISIKESVSLQEKQKKTQEELAGKQAAEKLAQRLGISMVNFNPEGSSSGATYRNPDSQHSDDDDKADSDSQDELDYPD